MYTHTCLGIFCIDFNCLFFLYSFRFEPYRILINYELLYLPSEVMFVIGFTCVVWQLDAANTELWFQRDSYFSIFTNSRPRIILGTKSHRERSHKCGPGFIQLAVFSNLLYQTYLLYVHQCLLFGSLCCCSFSRCTVCISHSVLS